jgi:hypothetical protein
MLKEVLQIVSKSLPKGTSLTFAIDEQNLLSYYKQLYAIMIPDQNGFHIVTALPIVYNEQVYEMYKAITMPVPNAQANLLAEYDLEYNYVAISKNKNHYILLSNVEA